MKSYSKFFPRESNKHFQVSERRESKNIQEMLAPSTVNIKSVIPASIENQIVRMLHDAIFLATCLVMALRDKLQVDCSV